MWNVVYNLKHFTKRIYALKELLNFVSLHQLSHDFQGTKVNKTYEENHPGYIIRYLTLSSTDVNQEVFNLQFCGPK